MGGRGKEMTGQSKWEEKQAYCTAADATCGGFDRQNRSLGERKACVDPCRLSVSRGICLSLPPIGGVLVGVGG